MHGWKTNARIEEWKRSLKSKRSELSIYGFSGIATEPYRVFEKWVKIERRVNNVKSQKSNVWCQMCDNLFNLHNTFLLISHLFFRSLAFSPCSIWDCLQKNISAKICVICVRLCAFLSCPMPCVHSEICSFVAFYPDEIKRISWGKRGKPVLPLPGLFPFTELKTKYSFE